MALKSGSRLRSQVCTTEVIVIRAAADHIDVRCGGEPMIDAAENAATGKSPAHGLDTGAVLGKRYTAPGLGDDLELLVTKAGTGTLSIGTTPLVVKEAKPLPSSD